MSSAKNVSVEASSSPQSSKSATTVDGPASVIAEGNFDPVYEAKARVLNNAMSEIGFGKYHKALFVVAGFGWLADNVRTPPPPNRDIVRRAHLTVY